MSGEIPTGGHEMNEGQAAQILRHLGRLEGKLDGLDRDVKSGREETAQTRTMVEGLRRDMNGRFKKLEHTVFGNEDDDKIGLAEKVRNLEDVRDIVLGNEKGGKIGIVERVRSLESGWAKLTTVAVIASSLVIEGIKFGWSYIVHPGKNP